MESTSTPSSSFCCELCQKNFVQKSSLNRHVREQHLQPGLYKCKQCGLRFSKKYNLQMHLKNIHTNKHPKTSKSLKSSQHNKNFKKSPKSNKSPNPQVDDMLEQNAQSVAESVLKELKQLQKDIQTIEAEEENSISAAAIELETVSYIYLKDNLYPSGHFKHLRVQTIKRLDGFTYLICEFCKKEFKKSYNFLRHHRIHTKIRPFICVLCKKSFPTVAQLKTHCSIHRLHEQFGCLRKLYKCPKCYEGFSSRQQLDKHLSSSLTCCDITFKCPQCCKTFKTLRTLLRHKHVEKDKEIDLLRKILPSPEPVSGQIEVANENFECNMCGLQLSSNIFLKQHENRHANLFKYQCRECKQYYATQAALGIHTKTHLKETTYKCLYCKKMFKTKQNCRQHMIKHLKLLLNSHETESKETLEEYSALIQNEETKICIIKSQKSKSSKTDTESLNESKELKYKCPECHKTFRYNAWLKKHFNYKHSAEKQSYECEKCLHKFRTKQSLENHLLLHSTTQRLKLTCQVCGRLYASSKSLKLHLRIHTQEKPFKCEKCFKLFRTSGHLIQHGKSNHKD